MGSRLAGALGAGAAEKEFCGEGIEGAGRGGIWCPFVFFGELVYTSSAEVKGSDE